MTFPTYPNINLSFEDNIAMVEIAAGSMNFLSVSLLESLVAVWDWADKEPECRVILLCTTGSVFSAGVDFTDFASGGDISPALLYKLAQRLFEGRKPIVAAIQGAAVGAGLGLAMIADERIAGPHAKFIANFVELGFHPGFALSVTLPHVIGTQNSSAMLMRAKQIEASEALKIGLVDELTNADNVRKTALIRAKSIAQKAPTAVQDVRHTLRKSILDNITKAMAHELKIQLKHFQTKDFQEGIKALLNKRKAIFTGS